MKLYKPNKKLNLLIYYVVFNLITIFITKLLDAVNSKKKLYKINNIIS